MNPVSLQVPLRKTGVPAPQRGRTSAIRQHFKNDGSVIKTAHIIAADGWEVDLSLWADAAECGPCHPGNDSH
ncbi:hypothetical protein [Streptomyces marianii]|uniref:Uncharacterized protein n=1 Tax=Streptomyces marianii TaxID=1817406 RepID=A0A5R9EGT6_9ACTN|nr:hypothetical protein [Streptomyces marianii]TLQ47054.1 hypothetical protein FEF34_32475 [Streptomyces marianii]